MVMMNFFTAKILKKNYVAKIICIFALEIDNFKKYKIKKQKF